MCLAVPAKIVSLEGPNAVVEIEGVRRACNVAFVEDPSVGEYVLMHAGFAIRKWTEDELREYYEIIATAGRPLPRKGGTKP
jgi:hydrogenase expression/formation protein HypC